MKKLKIGLFLILLPQFLLAQFYNHHWLMGYGGWANKGRIVFSDTSYTFSVEQRKMGFNGTQGNISNAIGDFLMSSNGVWIANSNNDTMLNGSGLNPGYYANAYPNGLLVINGNLFIPFPGDSNKYTLFHQTRLDPGTFLGGIYETVIDITLDSSRGGVISKNNNLITDQLSWGITACKHANGRDWWVFVMQDHSDTVYTLLYSINGVDTLYTQSLNFNIPSLGFGNVAQICFSENGGLFAYTIYDSASPANSYMILCDFDRCNGVFSNTRVIPVSLGDNIWGTSFAPSGEYLYANTSNYIFQINTITLQLDTVAVYDGFSFPIPQAATTFFNQYLAANGKIYLTSGSSVQHLHEINYPDSTGLACDVQQHVISLGVWHFRAVPNHPNYNLGPVVGSVCDTLSVGLTELQHEFHFGIYPNPTDDGFIKILYSLPQNKQGIFEVYNLTGQLVYKINLPHWSTMQFIQLPELSNGVYTCVIKSGYERVGKKLVIVQ